MRSIWNCSTLRSLGYANKEGFRNVLKLRAEIEGQWGDTPPPAEKYLDLSYYARALSGL